VPPITAKSGLGETLDNQRIMKLVEEALRQPDDEREQFLKQQCQGNSGDFEQALSYVRWEQRMQGFLLDPVIKRQEGEPQLEAGDLLENRFRIVRELAQGGMGVVYEAQDEKLGRRIALKCAKAGFGNELPPEVRHATEVSHPNVCKIYEIHTATIRQQIVDFITMEFLEGETLASRLNGGRIPRAEALAIARQLAAGVAEAHRNGVIHGDLKSNNVILSRTIDGALRAVITDFGLARRQGSQSRGIWGTPGYMAPELWLGDQPSVASDIYALGVVFFEMATGKVPSHGKTSKAPTNSLKATPWLEAASHKPPPVNRHWDRILARCLDPDPKKRYQTADSLAAALRPGHLWRNGTLAATAALAVIVTGVLTYRNATAPAETATLAVLPVEGSGPTRLKNAESEIGRLEGNKKIGFELLPAERANSATHLLRVNLASIGGQTNLRAVLSEGPSQVTLKTWEGVYGNEQWKYVPQALAGVVSAGLHLKPLAESLFINAQASTAYATGVQEIRQDSTLDAGLKDLGKAEAANPDSPLILATIAEAECIKYLTTQDDAWLKRSLEAERQSELRYPDTGAGHRAAGLLKATAGRFDDAEAELLRAIELEPANSENYRRLGSFVYRNTNQFDKALVALREAVELQPGYYKNQQNLGEFYLEHARYKEAVEHLLETVKLLPNAPNVRYELAQAYTDAGEFGKARQSLNVILERTGKAGAQYQSQLATILMYESKDAEAIPHLLSAVTETPEDYVLWTRLGIAERRAGHLAGSHEAMQKALVIAERELTQNPANGRARSVLGYVCAQLGRQRARAESETAQALQLDREWDVIWMAVLTYETLGMRDTAIALLRTAPAEILEDFGRWPDLAEFTADSRFKEVTAANAGNKEKQR